MALTGTPLRATAATTSLGLVPASIETSATGCVKVLGTHNHQAPTPQTSKTISNRAPKALDKEERTLQRPPNGESVDDKGWPATSKLDLDQAPCAYHANRGAQARFCA